MNERWHTIVLTAHGHIASARAFIDALCACDPRLEAVSFEVLTIDAFDPEESESYDLALIDAGDMAGDRAFMDAAGELDHVHVPIMHLVHGGQPDPFGEITGDVFIDADGPIESAAVKIVVMLKQQRTIRKMRRELGVAQRFQGGLRGEISKMHEELQLAALVQREFLPQPNASLYGIEFDALWRPANYVSGDIFDITRLDEDHIGVFIADAVGHGVPAALMTMVIARALPTKEVNGSNYRIVPPDEALQRLNAEMIRRQGETTRFATAAYAVINCRERTGRLAGAGHPAPMLFRGDDGTVEELSTTGGLLGVFPDETFDAIDFELALNDRMLLYSDGFEVAFPDDVTTARSIKMPTRRYEQQFADIARLETPSDMIAEIQRRLDSQPGSLHQVDDLTLICIKAGDVSRGATASAPAASRISA